MNLPVMKLEKQLYLKENQIMNIPQILKWVIGGIYKRFWTKLDHGTLLKCQFPNENNIENNSIVNYDLCGQLKYSLVNNWRAVGNLFETTNAVI